jgi:hypothetical protein
MLRHWIHINVLLENDMGRVCGDQHGEPFHPLCLRCLDNLATADDNFEEIGDFALVQPLASVSRSIIVRCW